MELHLHVPYAFRTRKVAIVLYCKVLSLNLRGELKIFGWVSNGIRPENTSGKSLLYQRMCIVVATETEASLVRWKLL
jgi:hypothetical protein